MSTLPQLSSGLPISTHTEVAILGAMMLDSVAVEDATSKLEAIDFSLDSHQRIYKAMLAVLARGYGLDYETVRVELERKHELSSVGGMNYLMYLTDGIPRNFNIESYVRIVKDKSLLRKGLAICYDGQVRFADQGEDGLTVLNEVGELLARAAEGARVEPTLEFQSAAEWERMERQAMGETRAFVTCGLGTYDLSHGGYALRETTVLAARPKIGKSTFLRQGVIANCELGDYVHLFTPEMPAGQVLRCLWAAVAKVPFARVRRPEQMSDAEMERVRAARKTVADWPLKVDDSSPISAPEVIQRARMVIRKQATKLIGVDYLQKLRFKGRSQDRHIEVTDAMVGFTNLAKNEDVALVIVSSLTEPSEKNRNQAPTLNDLRQSGDIKFEANTVLLLHRAVDTDSERLVGEGQLIVAAARAGQDGSRKIYFDGSMQKFVDEQTHLWAAR